ncbi:MAG: multidrug efflux SMR transporter [Oscillospiraceae bacterium]|nr:multidrug efflux SMR transporter [Oscillospiraceae bacterium]
MPYVFLGAAIISELLGTTLLKYSNGFTLLLPSLGSVLAYAMSCFFLAKCLQNINLSVAYATWCASGIVVTTLISVILFQENISIAGMIGLFFVITGVALLNFFG